MWEGIIEPCISQLLTNSLVPESFLPETRLYVDLARGLLRHCKRLVGWPTLLNKLLTGTDWANALTVPEAQQLLDFLFVEENRDKFQVEDWPEGTSLSVWIGNVNMANLTISL
jgi:hypothetical protein